MPTDHDLDDSSHISHIVGQESQTPFPARLSPEARKSAEVYYQSLRSELIERVKMRDQILIAYLGAVAALIGFALRPDAPSSTQSQTSTLLQALLVLLPMLSLGASAVICHHQEIMSVFTEYFAEDLGKAMPEVPMYDASKARRRYGRRAERALLLSQLLLLCGPWFLVVLLNWPYVQGQHMGAKEMLLIAGFVLDVLTAFRIISARSCRLAVLRRIFGRTF